MWGGGLCCGNAGESVQAALPMDWDSIQWTESSRRPGHSFPLGQTHGFDLATPVQQGFLSKYPKEEATFPAPQGSRGVSSPV